MTNKICITGATGFLGGYLVRLFKEKGWKITAFGRNENIGIRLMSENVSFVKGCLEDAEAVEQAVKGCKFVVHAGALSSAWGQYDDFFNTNVKGTENVLKACGSNGVSRLVFISSPSIYTQPVDKMNIQETEGDNSSKRPLE